MKQFRIIFNEGQKNDYCERCQFFTAANSQELKEKIKHFITGLNILSGRVDMVITKDVTIPEYKEVIKIKPGQY